MTEGQLRSKLKEAFANGTSSVLALLDSILSEEAPAYKQFLQIWGRYSRLSNQLNQNIIDTTAATIENNRIDKALIELTDQLSSKDFKSPTADSSGTPDKDLQILIKGKNIISQSNLDIKGDLNIGDKINLDD